MAQQMYRSLCKLPRAVARSERGQLRFGAWAWVTAPLIELSLAVLGFHRTLQWLEATSSAGATNSSPRPGRRVSPADGERLIGGVYQLHFVRGRCLPRALLQYWLHRRAGTPVRFVLGVKAPAWSEPTPLEAHAWVEPLEASGRRRGFRSLFTSELKAPVR